MARPAARCLRHLIPEFPRCEKIVTRVFGNFRDPQRAPRVSQCDSERPASSGNVPRHLGDDFATKSRRGENIMAPPRPLLRPTSPALLCPRPRSTSDRTALSWHSWARPRALWTARLLSPTPLRTVICNSLQSQLLLLVLVVPARERAAARAASILAAHHHMVARCSLGRARAWERRQGARGEDEDEEKREKEDGMDGGRQMEGMRTDACPAGGPPAAAGVGGIARAAGSTRATGAAGFSGTAGAADSTRATGAAGLSGTARAAVLVNGAHRDLERDRRRDRFGGVCTVSYGSPSSSSREVAARAAWAPLAAPSTDVSKSSTALSAVLRCVRSALSDLAESSCERPIWIMPASLAVLLGPLVSASFVAFSWYPPSGLVPSGRVRMSICCLHIWDAFNIFFFGSTSHFDVIRVWVPDLPKRPKRLPR